MVNVVLDAKNQSFKLCSVDGVDVVRKLGSAGGPMRCDALLDIVNA